ncbi:hypothetical protein [Gemmobacter sp. 24YEA27]|uniref:hypothetical protein n=1 Tax=Gemmobacter sp. 24YEA27 TaxID=3040672 RepID=UPI0024B374F7|nr:hypothetical protein [Gemmobacter sp. 24YEA27]
MTLTLAAAPFGMVWIALAQVLAAAVIFLYNARMLWRHAGVDWRLIARDCWPQCLAVVIAVWITRLMRDSDIAGSGLTTVLVLGTSLVLIHLMVLCLLDPRIPRRVATMLQRRDSKKY